MTDAPAGSAVEHPAATNPHEKAQPPGPGETVAIRRGQFGNGRTPDTSGYGGLIRHVKMPAPAARPYGSYFDEVADALQQYLAGYDDAIEAVVIHRGQLTFVVRRERLPEVMRVLRDEQSLRFEMCMGASGVHFPEDKGRELHVLYPLLSYTHNRRVAVETTCPDDDRHIPSVVSVYPTNDWHERETWDMFGVIFDGHPALTRILMPDDWPGHPLRKDYPLGGIPTEYKGANIPPPDLRRSY